jgi:hypothetical protein
VEKTGLLNEILWQENTKKKLKYAPRCSIHGATKFSEQQCVENVPLHLMRIIEELLE